MEGQNDTPIHEIIIETLHFEMMVMLGSQLMTHVLCHIVPYPPLDEEHEHKFKEISLPTDDISYPHI